MSVVAMPNLYAASSTQVHLRAMNQHPIMYYGLNGGSSLAAECVVGRGAVLASGAGEWQPQEEATNREA